MNLSQEGLLVAVLLLPSLVPVWGWGVGWGWGLWRCWLGVDGWVGAMGVSMASGWL